MAAYWNFNPTFLMATEWGKAILIALLDTGVNMQVTN